MRERAVISYYFQLHPILCLCEAEKNSFTHEAVLKMNVWKKKTAHSNL